MADFFLDHYVAYEIALHLRASGHTARTARDTRLTRSRDHEILTISAENLWIVVTHNARDFDLLHRAWHQWPVNWRVNPVPVHAGVLVLDPRLPVRKISQEILELISNTPNLDNRFFVRRSNQDWLERVVIP